MKRCAFVLAAAAAAFLCAPQPRAAASGCEVFGVVRDADGAAIVGIGVELSQGDTVRRTATDREGRYRFVATDAGAMTVSVVLADAAHDPARFRIRYENRPVAITSDSFTGDATCERNFDFAAPDERYEEREFPRQWWADVASLYVGFAQALSLSDRLGVQLGSTPLEVRAFYGSASPDTAFWVGTPSYAPDAKREPFIGLGVQASTRADLGWPSNREDHEVGHHVLALAFGGVHPRARNDLNHGGYWNNPTSADAWAEGFASFYAVMVAKHVRAQPRPHWLRVRGAVLDLELDYRPWDLGGLEEVAVAALLVDLEDGPEDHRSEPVQGVTIVDTGATAFDGGTLIHGVVQADGTSPVGTVLDLELIGGDGQAVGRTRAVVVADGDAQAKRGRFVATVPTGVDATGAQLSPHPAGDDDPVDLELEALWTAIADFTSTKPESHGRLFDVDDLHTALAKKFGGKDTDGDGTDDIDQLFIAHGLFADRNGNRRRDPEEPVGPTSHPGGEIVIDGQPTTRPSHDPRLRMALPPALRASVETRGETGASIIVVASSGDRAPAVYVPRPDADGRLTLIPPPAPVTEGELASITVLALAPGKQPAVVARYEAQEFLSGVESHSSSHLQLAADLEAIPSTDVGSSADLRLAWGAFVAGSVAFLAGLLLTLIGFFRSR